MSHLTLRLLGSPQIELDHSPCELKLRKALALLAIIATSDTPMMRDSLATMLWPETDAGRNQLRYALWMLRTVLGSQWLQADGEMVTLSPRTDLLVDASQFQTLLSQADILRQPVERLDGSCLVLLERAVAFYRDDFLAGFTLRSCPAFDEWQSLHTESYRQDLSVALHALVGGLTRNEKYRQAIPYARRWVALDPLHEPAQRSLMELYARIGQQTAAIRQFEACARSLQEELDVSPEEPTIALYQEILARHFPTVAEPSTQEISEELRPVTVLCAGLVAPQQDAAEDAERIADNTYRLWESLTQSLAAYQAHIDQMLGDSLLAVFGAEQVHEDDAERAIRAALTVGEEARGYGVAIGLGVNSGTANVARQAGQDQTSIAMGSVVNLAARLQAQASPGEILVGSTTFRQTQQIFDYTPVQVVLAGQTQSLDAYRLDRTLSRPRKARGLAGMVAPMIGRDSELTQLIRLVETVQQGEGRLALITGEAGIGKSRLVAELCAHIERHLPDIRWLEGRCQELGASTHFWPVREMMRSLFGLATSGQRGHGISRFIQKLVDDQALTLAQRADVLPILARLTGVRLGEPWDSRFDYEEPEATQSLMLQGLQHLMGALARQRPTVLVLEDLHWADTLSLDLLIQLMDGLADLPLLIIAVYRSEREHRVWQLPAAATHHCAGRFVEMTLHPLTPEKGGQLLRCLLGTELPPEGLEGEVVAQSEGNPFYLEEALRCLLENGRLVREGRNWRLSQTEMPVGVSDNVLSLILARAERLSPACRATLRRASVLGPRFSLTLLHALQKEESLQKSVLQPLVDQVFLYQESSYPEPVYAFTHALVRQALYGSLVEAERRELHRLAACTLEQNIQEPTPEEFAALAYHWEQSDQPERAVSYLLQAGNLARLAYANQEAVNFYRRALTIQEANGDLKGVARTHMALGLTHLNAHDYQESQAAYNVGYDLWQAANRSAPPVIGRSPRSLRELVGFSDVNLDPARQERLVLGCCFYRGLFEETPDLAPMPDLVRSWGVSGDGCTYTFRLHEDGRWSDGAPVTAHDVAFAWQRLLDPTAGFHLAPLLHDVVGAEAYHAGSELDPGRLGFKTLDALTLEVTLREPASHFLQLLTHPATFPLPRHVLGAIGSADWPSQEAVTNGPFRLVSWTPKVKMWGRDQHEVVAERNPDFSGRFPGNLQRFESGPLDWSIAAHLHDSRRLDVLGLSMMPDEESRRLLQTQGWHFLPNRHWDIVYLSFDTTHPPFDDVRVRRAFAMAIDRKRMARLFVPGAPPTTGGFVPRGMAGHSPDIGLPFDPDSARRLLAEAGYPGGIGFPEVEYVTPPQAGRLKETVMEFLDDYLGIRVSWQPLDGTDLPNPCRLFMWSHAAQYADPDAFLRFGFPWRDTGWRHPVYDRLLADARRTLDQQRRLALYQTADRILTEEAVIVPLYMGTSPSLVKPWVTHYPMSGTRWAYYKEIVLEPK